MEVEVTIKLLFSRPLSAIDLTFLYDILSQAMETNADSLFRTDDYELVDYDLEVQRKYDYG